MRRLGYLVATGSFAVLLAGPTAAALLVAPTAEASTGQNCTSLGPSATECSSPGNVQLDDSPPPQDPASIGVYPGPYPVPWDEGSR